MKRALWICALLALPASAGAEGETDYDPAYCGGADFSQRPTFSPLTDLPALLGGIATYRANPALLYYGPGDGDPWTNWYLEPDQRLALAKLAVMRGILDAYSLWDTYLGWFPPAAPCPPEAATVRQLDGTCNDALRPAMGAAGVRFGRNVMPLKPAAQAETDTLMDPNPREISRVLMTRDGGETVRAPFLNLLAAAWIQFQIHDWFNHTNHTDAFHHIPLAEDDPLWRPWRPSMAVAKTQPDPMRQAFEAPLPPVYQNEVTHWWDGSQIYGSDVATAERLRAFEGGKLLLDEDGLLPEAEDGFSDTGFRRNWWVGLSLFHTLFAQEHNAIAEMLADAYPQWDDQQLYDRARLINSALIVKIHTIEWTPAIIPNPTLEVGMNTNWGGLNAYFDPPLAALPPGVPESLAPILFGVAGGALDRKTYPSAEALTAGGVPAAQAQQVAALFNGEVPFSLTEEFVSVYRMHPLLPEGIELRSAARDVPAGKVDIAKTRDRKARQLLERLGLTDLAYSFGTQSPGQLVLRNYPTFMQQLEIPLLGPLDLAAVDVLRDRERGVPRYNEFRRQLFLRPLASIDELTDDADLRARLKQIYGAEPEAIERVDLLVGTLAEGTRPTCYGFGETLFQVFTLMATRRIQADRFYTDDFTPEVYTPEGMAWIADNGLKSVLLRHLQGLADTGLGEISNAFHPWPR